MATTLLITSETVFCLILCSTESVLVMAPLVMALPPAFMDFIGGSMMTDRLTQVMGKQNLSCTLN